MHNDLTGNGLPDLVIGLPMVSGGAGEILVFEGGRDLSGLTRADADYTIPFVPREWMITSRTSLAICDLDGDGATVALPSAVPAIHAQPLFR